LIIDNAGRITKLRDGDEFLDRIAGCIDHEKGGRKTPQF